MHLYVVSRGHKLWIDQFIGELQGKYLPFKFPDKKDPKKLMDCSIQVAVRPIQLYEIVFPEDAKDVVLTTVLGTQEPWSKGKSQHKKHDKFIFAMRKLLGLQPIPEYDKKNFMPITRESIEIVGIGLKKDYWQDCRDGKRYDHKANEFCFEAL